MKFLLIITFSFFIQNCASKAAPAFSPQATAQPANGFPQGGGGSDFTKEKEEKEEEDQNHDDEKDARKNDDGDDKTKEDTDEGEKTPGSDDPICIETYERTLSYLIDNCRTVLNAEQIEKSHERINRLLTQHRVNYILTLESGDLKAWPHSGSVQSLVDQENADLESLLEGTLVCANGGLDGVFTLSYIANYNDVPDRCLEFAPE